MEVDLIFKIAAIGILVAVLNQLLIRSGREEQGLMVVLAGLGCVLMLMVERSATCSTSSSPCSISDMEQVIQVTGLCVVGALLALVVKRGSPETALLLAVGAAVVVALALAGVVKELLAFLGELGSASGVSADLFVPLYKTIGIALVVQVGGNLCRDAGESALASVVETAGTLCALLAALPLLRAVLDMLLELMG